MARATPSLQLPTAVLVRRPGTCSKPSDFASTVRIEVAECLLRKAPRFLRVPPAGSSASNVSAACFRPVRSRVTELLERTARGRPCQSSRPCEPAEAGCRIAVRMERAEAGCRSERPARWHGRPRAAAGGDSHRGSRFQSTAYRFSTPSSQRLRTPRVSSSAKRAIRRGSLEASMNRSRSVSSAGSSETNRMQ